MEKNLLDEFDIEYNNDNNTNFADYGDEYNDVKLIEKHFKICTPHNSRVSQMSNVQQEALALFKKKNKDYGDSFATYGSVGVIVRIGDKIQRLLSVSKNGVALVDNESLRDTLIDLHNYAAMAVMLIDEKSS
jgi:hypothetical protein